MNRDLAYRLLLDRMDEVRGLGFDGLREFVNQKLITDAVYLRDGLIEIDVGVLWSNAKRRDLVIWGIASGTNWMKMERVDEQMLVSPGRSAAR